jgi:hypothetical protein
MNNLKSMKEQLTSVVQAQMGNMQNVNAKELGEAVDMIKDLSEAIYYCTITEAMEEKEKEEIHYYTDKRYPDYYRDVDREYGRMYYDDKPGAGTGYTGTRMMYTEQIPKTMMRDSREGRSGMSRRMYMESKEMHKDSTTQMHELDNYIKELGSDITEMIKDSTPEEKQVLQQKIANLAAKIK